MKISRDDLMFGVKIVLSFIILLTAGSYFTENSRESILFYAAYLLGFYIIKIIEALTHDLFLFYDRCEWRIKMFLFFRRIKKEGISGYVNGQFLLEIENEKRKRNS